MLSDEEKKAIEILGEFKKNGFHLLNLKYESRGSTTKHIENSIETVLNLIEKQSKEIEELKEENKEIREWKYVIDNPIDLKKLSELDLIKIFGKTYISEHKIKAKIDYLLKHYDNYLKYVKEVNQKCTK